MQFAITPVVPATCPLCRVGGIGFVPHDSSRATILPFPGAGIGFVPQRQLLARQYIRE